jgi:hypothetical protein
MRGELQLVAFTTTGLYVIETAMTGALAPKRCDVPTLNFAIVHLAQSMLKREVNLRLVAFTTGMDGR